MSHRLLSIDGGGVRGVVALEVLGRIEQVLRDETGDPGLVGGAGLLREPLVTYVRYDAETHPGSLEELGVAHLSAEDLDRIDGVDFIEEMCGFGRAISTRVEPAHFEGFL